MSVRSALFCVSPEGACCVQACAAEARTGSGAQSATMTLVSTAVVIGLEFADPAINGRPAVWEGRIRVSVFRKHTFCSKGTHPNPSDVGSRTPAVACPHTKQRANVARDRDLSLLFIRASSFRLHGRASFLTLAEGSLPPHVNTPGRS